MFGTAMCGIYKYIYFGFFFVTIFSPFNNVSACCHHALWCRACCHPFEDTLLLCILSSMVQYAEEMGQHFSVIVMDEDPDSGLLQVITLFGYCPRVMSRFLISYMCTYTPYDVSFLIARWTHEKEKNIYMK